MGQITAREVWYVNYLSKHKLEQFRARYITFLVGFFNKLSRVSWWILHCKVHPVLNSFIWIKILRVLEYVPWFLECSVLWIPGLWRQFSCLSLLLLFIALETEMLKKGHLRFSLAFSFFQFFRSVSTGFIALHVDSYG